MTLSLDERPNLALTTINGALGGASGTMGLTDASAFPIPTVGYNCVIWNPGATNLTPAEDVNAEIVRITGGSGNSRTILRAQEGTSAVSHADGDLVVAGVTGRIIDQIEADLNTELVVARRLIVGPWIQVDAAASATNAALELAGVSASPAAVVMPRAGSLTAIGTRFGGTITAGTLTMSARVSGSGQTLSAVLDASTQQSSATQAVGIDTFEAGDNMHATYTTSADFLPSGTYDVNVILEITYDS